MLAFMLVYYFIVVPIMVLLWALLKIAHKKAHARYLQEQRNRSSTAPRR